jgi:uncharacterized protein (DUF58 family)
MATQNPIEMEGTYPLPEAQLDRFLFKLDVPFPSLEVTCPKRPVSRDRHLVIPSRILVLLMLVPLGLAMAALADRSLLWPMLAADTFIALLALADALLARRPLIEVRRTSREVFSIGRSNQVTLELRSRARRRLHVEVTDDLFEHASAPELPLALDLRPGARAEAHYRVVPRRRGTYALGDHTIRYRSPLGLWTRQLTQPANQPVRIFPDVQAVRDYELLARQSRDAAARATRRRGGASEFEALREYQRDDEYRRIDWKATARRHKLIARTVPAGARPERRVHARRGPPDVGRERRPLPLRPRPQRDA